MGGAARAIGAGQAGDRGDVALGVGQPAVGATGRPVQAGARVGADPDLGARPRAGPRGDPGGLDAEVGARVGEGLAGERHVQHVEYLVEHLGPPVVGDAERGEVDRLVADPEAQHEPAAREVVEHDRVLGQA